MDYLTGKRLDLIGQQLTQILANQQETKMALDDIKTRLAAFDTQIDKIGAEIAAEVQGLKDQIAALQGSVVSQADIDDITAKLDSIGGKLQTLDDLNPDAPAA